MKNVEDSVVFRQFDMIGVGLYNELTTVHAVVILLLWAGAVYIVDS